MGAALLQTPELVLNDDQCKLLADALEKSAKYRSINFDPKKVADFELVAAIGSIYGVKFMEWRERIKKERSLNVTPMPDNLHEMSKNKQGQQAPSTGRNFSPSEVFGEQSAAI